jgi:hypothetical protein
MPQYPSKASDASASDIWGLTDQYRARAGDNWPVMPLPGQAAFTTPGTFTWIAPRGITAVSVVCVGGGGQATGGQYGDFYRGGGGGGLGWKNNIAVTPFQSYTVVVGGIGGDSYFISPTLVRGMGGGTDGYPGLSPGGGYVGDGGGNGGTGGNGYIDSAYGSGGGAGGYTGNGGAGYLHVSNEGPWPGSGGGGNGGGYQQAGRGVGLLGLGGGGASGQFYGGGASWFDAQYVAGTGAVRIIWPGYQGVTRAFPSTNTGDL